MMFDLIAGSNRNTNSRGHEGFLKRQVPKFQHHHQETFETLKLDCMPTRCIASLFSIFYHFVKIA